MNDLATASDNEFSAQDERDSAISWQGKVVIVGPGRRTEGGITEVIARVYNCLRADPDIDVVWVETHRSGSLFAKVRQAVSGILQMWRNIRRADIVHIHSSASVSFFRKSIFFWIARVFGKPVIWHLHSPDIDFTEFFGRDGVAGRYARRILMRCDSVVVLSRGWIELAKKVIPGANIEVIYNPVPAVDDSIQDLDSDAVAAADRQRILYLAHLIQRKGYPLLIQAFADIADEFPASRLVFAGSGETEQALAICRDYGIEDRVQFLGWIGDAERTRELRAAGILALPTYQEGLPMNILEAMKFGLAVVTTPVGGIPDVIQNGRNGILVPTGDAEALAAAIRGLFEKPEFQDAIGSAARATVAPFEPGAIANNWKALYAQVTDKKSRGEMQ